MKAKSTAMNPFLIPAGSGQMMDEVLESFGGTRERKQILAAVAGFYLFRAGDSDFTQFDENQILPILKSQVMAALRLLVADDEKLIDRALVLWNMTGRSPGQERRLMGLLSEKSPEEAFHILARYHRILMSGEKSRVIKREYYFMIDRWIAPRGEISLSLCTNKLAATLTANAIKSKNPKTEIKQSELKKSLKLLSHRPSLIRS